MAGDTRHLVVGGGIAGASVAHHLARATDDPVTVLERQSDPATATTAKSGAFLGHWGHESAAGLELLHESMGQYDALLGGSRPATGYVHGGRLRVATTVEGDRTLRRTFREWTGTAVPDEASAATGSVGGPVQYLDGDALERTLLLPDVDTDAATGALYSPTVGHFEDPAALAGAFLDRARANGATVETGTTVTGLRVENGAVTGVVTDRGERPADEVVCAAGPWNRALLSTAGVDLPVRHTRGPILVVERPDSTHGSPALFHEETGVYTRTNRDGTLFVGHYPGEYDAGTVLDPGDVGDEVPGDVRDLCLETIGTLIPGVDGVDGEECDAEGADADRSGATVRDEWVGIRSLTPDGDPVVGYTAVDGLSVVSFNANGIQMAPAAGSIVAAQVVDGEPTPHYDAVSISRFDGHDDCRPEW